MSRAWSLALPVVTVLVVSYSLLVAGVPRPVVGARVYGGPTEGTTDLSLRVETVQRDGENESPAGRGRLSVRARSVGGGAQEVSVVQAPNGVTDFNVPFPLPIHGPVDLELHDASGALLAHGGISLDGNRWAARARRRGGWIRGRANGALVLGIAAERGAFVVGSPDNLSIRVERAGSPVRGVSLIVTAEGARLGATSNLRSDERGRARIRIEPRELNPTVRIEAHGEFGESGLIESGLPVVPGALFARETESGAVVESAVPRTEAFFSVVSDRGRLRGGTLALTPNAQGGSVGNLSLSNLPPAAWLVLSSEVDLNSVAAVGWPLSSDLALGRGTEPAQTFDVADALLLDGLPAAFAREQERRSRVRWLTAAFIALAFALSVVLLVVRVRAADRDISRHLGEGLEAETVARIAPRRFLSLLVGLLALGLGFIALGLIVAARSR